MNTKNTTTGLEKPKLYSFQGNKKERQLYLCFLTVSRPFEKVGDRQGNLSLKRVYSSLVERLTVTDKWNQTISWRNSVYRIQRGTRKINHDMCNRYKCRLQIEIIFLHRFSHPNASNVSP